MGLSILGNEENAKRLLRVIGLWWNGAAFWIDGEPKSIYWSTPPDLDELVEGSPYTELEPDSARFTKGLATLRKAQAFDDDDRDHDGVLVGPKFVQWAPTQRARQYINEEFRADIESLGGHPIRDYPSVIPRAPNKPPADVFADPVLTGDNGSLTHRTMVATIIHLIRFNEGEELIRSYPAARNGGAPDLIAQTGSTRLGVEMLTKRYTSERTLARKWSMIEEGDCDAYQLIFESRAHANQALSILTESDRTNCQIKNYPRTPGNYDALSISKANDYLEKSRRQPGCYVGRLSSVRSYQEIFQHLPELPDAVLKTYNPETVQ